MPLNTGSTDPLTEQFETDSTVLCQTSDCLTPGKWRATFGGETRTLEILCTSCLGNCLTGPDVRVPVGMRPLHD